MAQKRRKHSPEFKAKVAIEALKGQETLSVLSERYEVSAEMICRWKSELVDNASSAFGKVDNGRSTANEDALYAKIGRLEMKLDFARQVSEKLRIPVPADD